MPRCCCWKFSLSTFGFCCCCCTVPISHETLPLLDTERKMPATHESITINEIYVSKSYIASKNKTPIQSRIRVVTTSDTHMHHQKTRMPPGDILIFAGDFTNWKTTDENSKIVIKWLASLDQYKYKLIIGGNHEVGINENDPDGTVAMFKQQANTIYLQDSSFEAFGLKFYGTPWHPKRGCLFNAEAFAKKPKDLKPIFGNIPSDTDFLITHVPPYGVRDNETAGHIGSDSLLYNSRDRIKPIMHVFGHVHGTNGISYLKGSETVYVNTATKVNVFDVIFENNDGQYGTELVVDDKESDEYKVEDNLIDQ